MDPQRLQQEYIEMLHQSKTLFCSTVLDQISQYEEELTKLQQSASSSNLTRVTTPTAPSTVSSHSESNFIESPPASTQSTSDALGSHSKQTLISMIHELQKQKQSSDTKITHLANEIIELQESQPQHDLHAISENDELQNDIQYLLHVNPSTYNNVKRYIQHMKKQSMARYSTMMQHAPRFSQQIIHNGAVRGLPHPPRRNTNIEDENALNMDANTEQDSIQMLHFVISCLNWKTDAKYETLREELLTNDIAAITNDIYQNMLQDATVLAQHDMNQWCGFTVDEILLLKLFCEYDEFARNFSKAYTMGCGSHHRAEFYQCAKVFHCIFEYKSVPIKKKRLQHLLPRNINNFGYIVKAVEIGWICSENRKKYLVFNCKDDILIPNDTNEYDTISYDDDDHLQTIAQFVGNIEYNKKKKKESNDSWNNSIMLRNYAWNNIKQLLSSQYLLIEQASLKKKSLFDILFYEEKLYKMALSKTFLDRKEINGDVYGFLFNHITLNVDNEHNEIVVDLSNANPKIFEYKPSYYKINTKISFNDDHIMLSASDSMYQSDKLKWIDFVERNLNNEDDDDYKSIASSKEEENEKEADIHAIIEEEEFEDDDVPQIYDENLSAFSIPISYLDCILNVNGLLKVIANSYYNKEIRMNSGNNAAFAVEIEYTISIGYSNADDRSHECVFRSSNQFLKMNFNVLMKIFYWQLIKIVGYDLHNLSQRIAFCSEHKSFIILSLIYNYNYRNKHKYSGDELSLFDNKSLFEYLFFDCHHYELCDLFPRNHDLLLKAPSFDRMTLIEYDSNRWHIILNAMPKLIHFDHETKQKFVPKRIMVYLSMDVELESHDDVKWKRYDINPYLISKRQILVQNVVCESCINWNNILLKRKEYELEDRYPMILLYYKIECEYACAESTNDDEHNLQNRNRIYTITSTVRNIHICSEIDMELNENETRIINQIENLNAVEKRLIICDNLILHENATIYSSYFNLKCNKCIDIRSGAAIIADARGFKGENVVFDDDNDKKEEEEKGGHCYASPYLNRSELIFACGGFGGYATNEHICIEYNKNNNNYNGLFHYLGTNFGADSAADSYMNPYYRGFVDIFSSGIGTRSNKVEHILNFRDCYFISGDLGVWFAIDLKFCKLKVSHYALRHIDVESCYLRNWQIEAKCSDDDDEWQLLNEHVNDCSLHDANQWSVWQINNNNNNNYYQYFRIKMNGENSAKSDAIHAAKNKKAEKFHNMLNLKGVFENTAHNEYILCCAGFELFGDLILNDNHGANNTKLEFELQEIENQHFEYEYDFDESGILYWIGTQYGAKQKWRNPSRSLRVAVERGKQSEKGSVDDIVDRAHDECRFLDYFIVDFRQIVICANKYTLKLLNNDNKKNNKKNNIEDGHHCWCIKASTNKKDWKIIKEHMNSNENENNNDNASASFDIDCDEYYRYFKIENMNLLNELHCSGFEIYGDIKYNSLLFHKLPKIKSGGNAGGIINLSAPICKFDENCRISANGENAHNSSGGGGAAGNILIDAQQIEMSHECKIECVGGKAANSNNDGENGRIRIFCKNNMAKNTYKIIQQSCNPKPLIV